jgi:hypothetical protein
MSKEGFMGDVRVRHRSKSGGLPSGEGFRILSTKKTEYSS